MGQQNDKAASECAGLYYEQKYVYNWKIILTENTALSKPEAFWRYQMLGKLNFPDGNWEEDLYVGKPV